MLLVDRKLNILMMPSWYTNIDATKFTTGIFHYEQAMDLKKYCNVAMYYPFDRVLKEDFTANNERGMYTYRSRFIQSQRIRNRIRIFKAFCKIRKEFKPDIIHVHVAVEAGKYAAFLGKLFHIPVVITEHSSVEVSLAGKIGIVLSKYVYERCSYIACCSDDLQKKLQKHFPHINFGVVYNGVQPECILKKTDENYYRQGFINIVIVAAFYSLDIKGYQFLLPAIRQVIDEGYKVVLHIVGDGVYKEHYKKLVKDLDIEEFCIFYGECDREKVYQIVSQMDFFVSSSILECSGVSVQEAMLLGKPILVTRSGGANSLVTEDTAIVVDRESTKALTVGIKEMIARLGEFDRKKIKRYAVDKFEISNISKKYIKIYEDILK